MRTDTLIKNEGMKALVNALGIVEAEKFIALIQREPFDYTTWRKTLWSGKSADEIFDEAKAFEETHGK